MDDSELIFFDTFSHDMRHFQSSVRLSEIRIIPLGARVEANFPNGDRLGATNPSSFDISFFVNDLSRNTASTFASCGSFSYKQNVNTRFVLGDSRVTDGLLIRGAYQTLTIAVFGTIVENPSQLKEEKDEEEDRQTPIETQSPSEFQDQDSQNSTGQKDERIGWDEKDARSRVEMEDVMSPEAMDDKFIGSDINTPSLEELSPAAVSAFSDSKSLPSPDDFARDNERREEPDPPKLPPVDPDLLENISPDNSIGELEADLISDDEFICGDEEEQGQGGQEEQDDIELESISSDEDDLDEVDVDDIDFADTSDYISMFNPSQPNLNQIQYLKIPDHFFSRHFCKDSVDIFSSFLLGSLNDKNVSDERKLETIENIIISCDPRTLDANLTRSLWSWLKDSLEGFPKEPSVRVRSLKAAFKLLIWILASNDGVVLDDSTVVILLKHYSEPLMSVPIKLLILQTLDASCNTPKGMMNFLNQKYDIQQGPQTLYQWMLNSITEKSTSRTLVSLSTLLKKTQLFECLILFRHISRSSNDGNREKRLIPILEQMLQLMSQMERFMSQPIRFLPATSIFEVKQDVCPYPILYKWMDALDFMTCCQMIATKNSQVDTLMFQVLCAVNFKLGGNCFLLSNTANCQALNQLLPHFHTMSHDNQLINDTLAYSLKITQTIDTIFSILMPVKAFKIRIDDVNLCGNLHQLYMFVFSPMGRRELSRVLTDPAVFPRLVDIMKVLSDDGNDDEAYQVVKCCLRRIVFHSIQHKEWDIIQFFKSHGHDILWFSRVDDDQPLYHSKMKSMLELVSDSHEPKYYETLMTFLKKTIDTPTGKLPSLQRLISSELIFGLRIIQELCVSDDTLPHQLKYDYSLLHIHSNDGLQTILTLLDKISKACLRPRVMRLGLNVSESYLLTSITIPALNILHELIKSLIETMRSSFRDTTPIPIVLQVHSVLTRLFPKESMFFEESQKLSQVIIRILMKYARSFLTPENIGTDRLKKSIWTKMMSEVILHAISSPLNTKSGLLVLHELLPHPLPLEISNKTPQDEEHSSCIENSRKLWSAHLLPLNQEIIDLVLSLGLYYNREILDLFVNICIKISDVSFLTASCVTKGMTTLLMESYERPESLQRFSYVFSHLLKLSSFKIAFIHEMHSDGRQASIWISKLSEIVDSKDSQMMELLIEILYKICNTSNPNFESPDGTQQISTFIPPKEVLSTISYEIWKQLKDGHVTHPIKWILRCLEILHLLCDSDIGLVSIKNGLKDGNEDSISRFVDKILALILCDSSHISMGRLILESLGSLLTKMIRSSLDESIYKFSQDEMRVILKSSDGGPDALSSLDRCRQLLLKYQSDTQYESTIHILEQLSYKFRNATLATPQVRQEPAAPKPESLSVIFSRRMIFGKGDPDLLKFEPPAAHQRIEEHHLDLESLASGYLGPHFDIRSTLRDMNIDDEGQTGGNESQEVTPEAPVKQNKQLLISAKATVAFSGKSPLQRGRGFGRGMSRSNDPFRSRPPNTSRPPSMHVDDFLAMEHPSVTNKRVKEFTKRTVSAPSPATKPNVMSRLGYHEAQRRRGSLMSPIPRSIPEDTNRSPPVWIKNNPGGHPSQPPKRRDLMMSDASKRNRGNMW